MGGVLSHVLCYVNILPLTLFPMFAIILLRTTEEQYFWVSYFFGMPQISGGDNLDTVIRMN